MLKRLEHSGSQHDQVRGALHLHTLLPDQTIQPASIDGVLLEGGCLKQLNEVLNGGTNLSTNFNLLQCQDKRATGMLTGGTLSKQVTELTISKLVNSSVGANAEVSPYIAGGLELHTLDGSRGRLETLIGILGSDTGSNHMRVNRLVVLLEEVNRRVSVHVRLSVELTDLRNFVEWDSHGNLKLSGRHVDSSNSLSNRVLDLQTRIQLQEEERIRCSVVQVLDGTGTLVANVLGQPLCSPLHLLESLRGHNGRWTLLENLLETTLGRAITTVQGNSVSVLISNNLNLDVTGILTKLHKENGTSDDLVGHLNIRVLQIILVVNETDTLPSSSLTCLNHDTFLVADLLCSLDSLLNRTASSHLESVIGDGTLSGKLGYKRTIIHTSKRSTPRDGRHLSGLGENVGGNLISKYTHHGTSRSNELDSERIEGVWQFGVLTSMTPARPYSINTLLLGNFANNIHVGVVVGVLSSRNLNERIGQADELSIGFEILGGGHGNEGDRLLVS
mmetsp:Transcript_9802/g.14587  ORF Transcript_9802/g.14587 Transcript_9802/m.14587 type:complete len:503 (-) Transcript_9802:439-1947(-)